MRGGSTLAPWSEFGREVTGEDRFDEPPLEFSGRRSTGGDEGTFVQKMVVMIQVLWTLIDLD